LNDFLGERAYGLIQAWTLKIWGIQAWALERAMDIFQLSLDKCLGVLTFNQELSPLEVINQ